SLARSALQPHSPPRACHSRPCPPPLCGTPHSSLSSSLNPTPPPDIYTLSLHDALPIFASIEAIEHDLDEGRPLVAGAGSRKAVEIGRHTSELQSLTNLVCRLLLEKKKRSPGNRRAMTISA